MDAHIRLAARCVNDAFERVMERPKEPASLDREIMGLAFPAIFNGVMH
jgi:hypothetical protein